MQHNRSRGEKVLKKLPCEAAAQTSEQMGCEVSGTASVLLGERRRGVKLMQLLFTDRI